MDPLVAHCEGVYVCVWGGGEVVCACVCVCEGKKQRDGGVFEGEVYTWEGKGNQNVNSIVEH